MPRKKKTEKERKITAEETRIRHILADLDDNKLKMVLPMIKTIAFMTVSLQELEKIINEQGYTSEYQNGENQYGTKQSDEVKTHLAMTKNRDAALKVLADYAPEAKGEKSRLQRLRDE